MKKNIVLVGPTPPPTGGVSIHVKRFAFLMKQFGVPCKVISTTSSESSDSVIGVSDNLVAGLVRSLPGVRGAIVIVHSSELYGTIVALLCKIFGGEVVQYFHNGRALRKLGRHKLLGSCWGWALRRLDRVFVVNSEIQHDIEVLSKMRGLVRKVNPYLPPSPSELQLGDLDEVLYPGRTYIGWCGIATGDRAEIYGFSYFLDLLLAVASKLPNVVGVIGVGGEIDRDSLSDEVIARFNAVSSRLICVPENISFAAVMTRLHVFVRPTSSDGDAVSVREGLSLGAYVLASDVVERPQGVALYRFGDFHDGLSKLLDLIKKPRSRYENGCSFDEVQRQEALMLDSADKICALVESAQG